MIQVNDDQGWGMMMYKRMIKAAWFNVRDAKDFLAG